MIYLKDYLNKQNYCTNDYWTKWFWEWLLNNYFWKLILQNKKIAEKMITKQWIIEQKWLLSNGLLKSTGLLNELLNY
jgi:hypothetical protein